MYIGCVLAISFEGTITPVSPARELCYRRRGKTTARFDAMKRMSKRGCEIVGDNKMYLENV
jgi:hypothetical protein